MKISAMLDPNEPVWALVMPCAWSDRQNIKEGDVLCGRVTRWHCEGRLVYPVTEDFGILHPQSPLVLSDGKV